MSLKLIKEAWARITVCSCHNMDAYMGKTMAAQRIFQGERQEILKEKQGHLKT